MLKTGSNNVVGATLFLVVNSNEQYCWAQISLQSGVTMLNNIVDNVEQCCPNNVVASGFQQLLIFGRVIQNATILPAWRFWHKIIIITSLMTYHLGPWKCYDTCMCKNAQIVTNMLISCKKSIVHKLLTRCISTACSKLCWQCRAGFTCS